VTDKSRYTFAITLDDADRGTVDWECPHCHWKKAAQKIVGKTIVCPSCWSEIDWRWAHRQQENEDDETATRQ
jgi:hypothetical protein